MDALTSWIANLDIPLLTQVASALNNEALIMLVTFLFVLLAERRPEKLKKILLAIALAVLLITVAKYAIKTERPCDSLHSKTECPWSYAFPSGHTLVVFTVALAFLNKPVFPFFLIYAIFVAFTRIYLGVHSFEDIAGGVALSPLVYFTADKLWKKISAGRDGKIEK